MFTHKIVLSLVCIATGGTVLAQDAQTTRTVAELPVELEGTGERAPAPPPESSAQDPGNADPAAQSYGIGSLASEDQISAIDIDVMPGGAGLPDGSGTFADGKQVYENSCAACHGADLEGVPELGAPQLIGGRDTLASDKPVKTVESYWPYASTLFDYVHRAMPMDSPGSLSPDEVYAVSAYILGRAGITPDDPDAALDREGFAGITMPNKGGFVDDPRGPDSY